jgi:hypothetical protein
MNKEGLSGEERKCDPVRVPYHELGDRLVDTAGFTSIVVRDYERVIGHPGRQKLERGAGGAVGVNVEVDERKRFQAWLPPRVRKIAFDDGDVAFMCPEEVLDGLS